MGFLTHVAGKNPKGPKIEKKFKIALRIENFNRD